MEDAKDNAESVLKVILAPISTSMPQPYSINIQFGDGYKTILLDNSHINFLD